MIRQFVFSFYNMEGEGWGGGGERPAGVLPFESGRGLGWAKIPPGSDPQNRRRTDLVVWVFNLPYEREGGLGGAKRPHGGDPQNRRINDLVVCVLILQYERGEVWGGGRSPPHEATLKINV